MRIALAPAEVRAEIEAWVQAEPRCVRELEVRVVPTRGGGLYVSAVEDGRVRERVVPDAQSAAVLVVSWMADDSLDPTFEDRVDPTPLPPPSPVRVPEVDGLDPGTVHVRAIAPHGRGAPRPSVLVGGSGGRDGGELRVQLDVLAGAGWNLGIAGGMSPSRREEQSSARIVIGASRAVTQRWSLRAQLGLGAEVEEGHGRRRGDLMTRRHDEHRVAPSVEVGAFVEARLADRWDLLVGPVATVRPDGGALGGFLGLRRGL